MILPKEKIIIPHFQPKKRHHCVSFCDDITVVEFECDKCTLSVNKPPLCVSRNLKNSIFLPPQVSKFFDRYLPYDIEKKNIMTILKEISNKKYQRKCSSPFDEEDGLIAKLKVANQNAVKQEDLRKCLYRSTQSVPNRDGFFSMTSKEKQWLASIQTYHLNEVCTNDYYFNKFMEKNHPNTNVKNISEFMKEIKEENIKKYNYHQNHNSDFSMHNCLGKIPVFTVAHARQVLEENLFPQNTDLNLISSQMNEIKTESNILLQIEWYYDILFKIEEETTMEIKNKYLKELLLNLLKTENILNFMNKNKGQKLYFQLYKLLSHHQQFIFWKNILASLPNFYKLNKSTRPLNSFLILFKSWLLSNIDLSNVVILSQSIESILSFLIADKFGISVINLTVLSSSNVKRILKSNEMDRSNWAMFLNKLITCIDHHPHIEFPLLGSKKHFKQFLNAIAPDNIHLNF